MHLHPHDPALNTKGHDITSALFLSSHPYGHAQVIKIVTSAYSKITQTCMGKCTMPTQGYKIAAVRLGGSSLSL